MEIQESPLPETESKRVGHSGPLVTSKMRSSSNRSARSKEDDQCYVEVTLDVHDDDTVVLRNIRGADPETLAKQASKPEGRPSLASQLSFKLKQVSHELKRMKSSLSFKKVDRTTKPGVARALKGLKFMTRNVCSEGWPEIETRFEALAVNGTLPKSVFAQCIGM